MDVLQAEKVFAKVKQLEPYRIEGKQLCEVDKSSVCVLVSGTTGLGLSPCLGTLCCVLGQDTSLSQCLSPLRCINAYWKFNAGGLTL